MILHHQLKQYLVHNLRYGENQHDKQTQGVAAVVLVMPDPNTAWGIDLSLWNRPPVDLRRMRDEYGLMFLFIKGCDGTVTSRYFAEHVSNAKALGLPWGIYDWLYPNNRVSIDAQTTAWSNQARVTQPPLGVAIDVEQTWYAGQSANPTAADLDRAHDLLEAKYEPPLVYSSPGYIDSYLQGFNWSKVEDRLWMAHWGAQTPTTPPGAGWRYHQFGILDGKQLDPNGNYEIDGNRYNGTRAEFANRYGGGNPEPPPTNGGTVDKFMQVTNAVSNSLNIRTSGANLGSQNDLGAFNLLRGDIVHVVEINPTGYARFDALYRNGVLKEMPTSPTSQYWAATRESATVYLADVVFTPPQPPDNTEIPYKQTFVIGGGEYEQHTHVVEGVLRRRTP